MLLKTKILLGLLIFVAGISLYFIFYSKNETPEEPDDVLEELDDVLEEPDNVPQEPTPTTTPAQPLVPTTKPSGPVKPVVVKPVVVKPAVEPVVVKPAVEPVKRKLTKQELSVFTSKIRKFFEGPGGDECRGTIYSAMFRDFAGPLEFDDKTITKMIDPRRNSFKSTEDTWERDYGFVPPDLLKKYFQFMSMGGQRYIMQQCQRR